MITHFMVRLPTVSGGLAGQVSGAYMRMPIEIPDPTIGDGGMLDTTDHAMVAPSAGAFTLFGQIWWFNGCAMTPKGTFVAKPYKLAAGYGPLWDANDKLIGSVTGSVGIIPPGLGSPYYSNSSPPSGPPVISCAAQFAGLRVEVEEGDKIYLAGFGTEYSSGSLRIDNVHSGFWGWFEA